MLHSSYGCSEHECRLQNATALCIPFKCHAYACVDSYASQFQALDHHLPHLVLHELVHDYSHDEHDLVRVVGERYSGTGKEEIGVKLSVRVEP